jgi:hypothetical protein
MNVSLASTGWLSATPRLLLIHSLDKVYLNPLRQVLDAVRQSRDILTGT